jgi:hypothetical protein
MIEAVKQIWAEIKQGENVDLYLTLVVALLLAGLNIFGIGLSMIGSVTLAVLALLSFSSLVNRRKLEEALDKLSRDKDVLLDRFPTNREIDMEGAKELWLVGLTLHKTIDGYYSLLHKKLNQGDHVRVLIVDPESPYEAIVAQRKFSPTTIQGIQNYQKSTLSLLCSLKKIAPQNMEIRITDYPPFFGALAADLESIEGIIYIEQYSYKMLNEDLPKLVFRKNDMNWFQYYRQQIINMWNDSNEWNCALHEGQP